MSEPYKFIFEDGCDHGDKRHCIDATASGHTCLTCGTGTSVTQMLRVTRLDHFFPTLQDIHAARKALKEKTTLPLKPVSTSLSPSS